MTPEIADAALWLLGAAGVVLLLLLVRQRQISTRTRQRAETLQRSLVARDQEVAFLVTTRLPALKDALLVQQQAVPPLSNEGLVGTPFADGLAAILEAFGSVVAEVRQHADHSVRDTLGGIIGKVQAVVGEQEVELRAMQDRHQNPDVLADLLRLDHLNAQMMRRAQSIAVLCGSWVGRQRDASVLTEVIRGAISKIADYQRVRFAENEDILVQAHVVEAVVTSLAELLENAVSRTQPTAQVWVGIEPAYNGVAVTVDDAGIGMDAQQLWAARQLLSGEKPVDITRLGDPPRIGFAAVAALAGRYHFSAHLDGQSSHGGLRAVIFLPSPLLSQVPRSRPIPVAAGNASQASVHRSGLPQRPQRTREVSAEPDQVQPAPAVAEPPRRSPQEAGARLGAFQQSSRSAHGTPLSPNNFDGR